MQYGLACVVGRRSCHFATVRRRAGHDIRFFLATRLAPKAKEYRIVRGRTRAVRAIIADAI